MNRPILTGTLLLAGVAMASCGSSPPAAGGAATTSPSPGPRARNGVSGELVQVNGTTLVINASTGDVTVAYSDSTTFLKTSTGTFQDIAAGKCIVVTGSKDASGSVAAASVRLSEKINGTCAPRQGPGGGGFGGARPTPRPDASPRPNQGNVAFAGGEVTAVSGVNVTVQPATGPAVTVVVPTTVRVSKSSAALASDLALHQCLAAQGPRDGTGRVAARAISIVPAGPSGCFTGGGGFGGSGRGPAGGVPPPGD